MLLALALVVPTDLRVVPEHLAASLHTDATAPIPHTHQTKQSFHPATKPPTPTVKPWQTETIPADQEHPEILRTNSEVPPGIPVIEATGRASAGPSARTPPDDPAPGQQESAKIASLPLSQRCNVQVRPNYPKLAREDGIEQGKVVARLSLDAKGRVTAVTILEASPKGYFERETLSAARQWQCLPSGKDGDTVRVPFLFALD